MTFPAARVGDATAHGGTITVGFPTVLIEGMPAARVGDMHVCPMLNPGGVPHVGGPITTGSPTVFIGFMPAARLGDWVTCVGPPDTIVTGAATVLIGGAAPVAPPAPPSIETPGEEGGSEAYVANYQWAVNAVAGVNAMVGWNVVAAAAVAAGVVGAVAVGLVVWVAVVKVRDANVGDPPNTPWPWSGFSPHSRLASERVSDDAPVYFL